MPVPGTPKRDRIQTGDGAIVPTFSVQRVQRSRATRNLQARQAYVEDEIVTEYFVLRCLLLRFVLFLFFILNDLCVTRPPQIPSTRPHRRSRVYRCEVPRPSKLETGVKSQTSANIPVRFSFDTSFQAETSLTLKTARK